jgi:hypothetical protein
MGLAWVPDDTGRAVAPASGREWNSGPRHRRPTLLARSGQAVAGRITALARTDADSADTAPSSSPHRSRQPAMTARRYWA